MEETTLLFIEHDEELRTDKAHCGSCLSDEQANVVTDKPHCDGCG